MSGILPSSVPRQGPAPAPSDGGLDSAASDRSSRRARALGLPAGRAPGVPASLFGTYLRPRELLIYPFFEYTLDNDREYQPAEFGVGPDVDFRGRFRGTSSQLFGYGVSDRIGVELEAAYVTARLEKSPADTFATPAIKRQSGITDLEAQVRAQLLDNALGISSKATDWALQGGVMSHLAR